MIPARPKVAELAFQLYGRSLHPELFEIHKQRTFERANYSVDLSITNTGHVMTWRCGNMTLTEVSASAQHPLPQKRRLMYNLLRGEMNDSVDCRDGVKYECSAQLETVRADVFWAFQKQMHEERELDGIMHSFDPNGRIALGAISFVHVVTRSKEVTIRACHTFPDDYAIVRTQSKIKLPAQKTPPEATA